MLRKVRTLFSSYDRSGYDGDRPRDPYMDVLREMQSPVKPRRSSLREVLARLRPARARATTGLRK